MSASACSRMDSKVFEMADLEDRHAHTGKRDQVTLNLLEHRERQDRRAGRKIEDALHDSHHWAPCDSATKSRKRLSEFRVFVADPFRSSLSADREYPRFRPES